MNQCLNPLKVATGSNLVGVGRAAVHADRVGAGGDFEAGFVRRWGGHEECLRCTRGEAAGDELVADPVDRYVVNVGTVPRSPSPSPLRGGGGQARCRLMVSGWGGGSVVVRGRESRLHGEGTQRADSNAMAMPGGRR